MLIGAAQYVALRPVSPAAPALRGSAWVIVQAVVVGKVPTRPRHAATLRATMTPRLLDLSRAAGDSHLGQTLVRLARLAQARHQFITAGALGESHPLSTEIEAEGLSLGAAIPPSRIEAAPGQDRCHKEVDR